MEKNGRKKKLKTNILDNNLKIKTLEEDTIR